MYIAPIAPAVALVISWLTMFLVGTDLFVLSPLLPRSAADYGVSPTLAGWCVTAFSLAYMATAPAAWSCSGSGRTTAGANLFFARACVG